MLNTIGYEGSKLTDFIQTLQTAEIDLVIDVRDRAQSRRPGFSKTALKENLAVAGIRYLHLKELGDPKEGREAARSGDYVKFRSIFAQVLDTAAAKAALDEIVSASERESVCLLCYERDQSQCHRALISNVIETKTGNKTRHLGVRKFEQIQQHARRVLDPRESAPA